MGTHEEEIKPPRVHHVPSCSVNLEVSVLVASTHTPWMSFRMSSEEGRK